MSQPTLDTFSSLPTEIHLQILSFIVDWQITDNSYKKTHAKIIASYQSLNTNINTSLQQQFNNYWWKLLTTNFKFSPSSIDYKTLENLRMEIIQLSSCKRIILQAHYTKFKLWRQPKCYEIPIGNDEVRIVVLGRGGVGKSAITISFIQNSFIDCDYDPTIEDSYRKFLIVNNRQVMFDILDTAYSEEHSPMKKQYMKYSHGFIVVCDITDRPTLVEVNSSVNYLVQAQKREVNDMAIVFALNKIDLLNDSDRKKSVEDFSSEIKEIAKEFSLTNWKILESSARRRQNIEEIFFEIAQRRQYYDIVDDYKLVKNIYSMQSHPKEHSKHKKCSLM